MGQQTGDQGALVEQANTLDELRQSAVDVDDALYSEEEAIYDEQEAIDGYAEISPLDRQRIQSNLDAIRIRIDAQSEAASRVIHLLNNSPDLMGIGERLTEELARLESDGQTLFQTFGDLMLELEALLVSHTIDPDIEDSLRGTLVQVDQLLENIATAQVNSYEALNEITSAIEFSDPAQQVASDLAASVSSIRGLHTAAEAALANLPDATRADDGPGAGGGGNNEDPENPVQRPRQAQQERPNAPTELRASSRPEREVVLRWSYEGVRPDRFIIRRQKRVDNAWQDLPDITVNNGQHDATHSKSAPMPESVSRLKPPRATRSVAPVVNGSILMRGHRLTSLR